MAEQKESSVLFSLKELMNLEEDRIRQEESERRRQADAAEQARLESERRAREAEEARLRAEDDRRRGEETRAREEQTRLEAIRHAEVEKARLEAEAAARMESLRNQQEHERQIASLAHDKSKKNLKFAAFGIGGVLLLALVGGGFAINASMQEKEQADAKHAQEMAAQQADLDAQKREAAELTSKLSSLQADLAKASSDAERQRIMNQINDAKNAAPVRKTTRPGGGGGGGDKSSPAAKPCNCTPGDPLCSCL